jgi:hypothetical protein
VGSDHQGSALRGSFLTPTASQIENLAGPRWDWVRQHQIVNAIRIAACIDEFGPAPQQAGGCQFDGHNDFQLVNGVCGRDLNNGSAPGDKLGVISDVDGR